MPAEPCFIVEYRPRCRRAGNAHTMQQLNQWLVEDPAFDLDVFLRAEAVRRFCQLDCPLCKKPLRLQMASDHPDDYRLNELKPSGTSFGGGPVTYYLLEELVIPPGRLVLSAG